MKRLVRWLLGLIVAVGALRRGAVEREPERERIVAPASSSARAELTVAALLLASAASAVLFVVAYGLDWSTQVLGASLAGALALLGVAMIVAAKGVIATEELVEDYPDEGDPQAERDVAAIIRESGDGITRKKLLGGAAVVAGGAVTTALVTPAVGLGPVFDTSRLNESPWRAGRRLVDEDGVALNADDLVPGPFYTAFAEGVEKRLIGSSLIVVRIDPAHLRLPPERADWAPEGILAYSKICPHAGCAVSLYRNPKFEPTQPKPALVCPCHYSTFDPTDGGTVLFGPAGRPLPQLPLTIDADRTVRAAGDFSTPAGPSWWGVRNR